MNAIGIVLCVSAVVLPTTYGLVVRRVAARQSGWDRLGRRYPAGHGPAGGVEFSGQTIRVNGRPYRQHLRVRLGGAGIRIHMPPAWRPFHRPVLIPWDDVVAGGVSDDTDDVTLRVGDAADRVTLTGRSAAGAARVLARRDARRVRRGHR